MTHLSCSFHQLSLTQSRYMTKISYLGVSNYWAHKRYSHRWGILSKISSNYAWNIYLITFNWKLHLICEHWYNNLAAIIVIHLYCKNITARAKHFSHFFKYQKNCLYETFMLCFNVCKRFWAFNKHVKNIWFGLVWDLAKNHPFMASLGTKMSHIIKKNPLQVT